MNRVELLAVPGLPLVKAGDAIPVKGIEVLGPLPGEYATYVNFTAAASSGAQNMDAAKKFIAFMSGPMMAPLLKAKGLEVHP